MLGTEFYVFLLAMVLAIVLLFLMVWHVSQGIYLASSYCNGWCNHHNGWSFSADHVGRAEKRLPEPRRLLPEPQQGRLSAFSTVH